MNSQISLNNPSFEGEPADATTPMGWFECAKYTTPDILPGFWGVYQEASEGETYIGLITRQNSTAEAIGQRLSTKLEKNTCYKFSFDLAHSNTYSGFNKPIKLRIWIGEEKCEQDQLIYESTLIRNRKWKQHIVDFISDNDAKYIIFEAYISDDSFSHKGNLLLDNVSSLYMCGKA